MVGKMDLIGDDIFFHSRCEVAPRSREQEERQSRVDWGRYGRYGEINHITKNFRTISTFWYGLGLEWDQDLIEKLTWRRTHQNSERSRKQIGPKIEIRPNEYRQNVDLVLEFHMDASKPKNIPSRAKTYYFLW